ncbi:MAG: 16S rRNA (cytidine(1402)-2'-O)-methyltransferase [Chloroflexi bacterium]|nr:16S rRNA (cytidine(1402)-2'-O)-methyltransferase [Chloroflexota bacterium]
MLYLVSTPIGNLGDMSARAIEVLGQVDLIASEDTRKTGRLLQRFAIDTPQVPFHEHNEQAMVEQLISQLRRGRSIAVVTDAGTPGIADPGYSIVRRALDEDIEITMVPGPAAFVMAIVLSGLPVHSFCFRGFTPHKRSARRRFFEADVGIPYTLIYYESPHRLLKSLNDALEVFGDRRAALANDLTKLYELMLRGRLSELIEAVEQRPIQGEWVLVIAGTGDRVRDEQADDSLEGAQP